MDLSDKNFFPCPCGYQICRFCWHKIREDGNQRCPACRKVYDETEAEFTPVPLEEINRMKMKKRAVRERREAAAEAELDKTPAGMALTNEIVNSRKHLSEFRVVQRNLVYVIGISAKIAHEHILKEPEFFGQFGKIIKIVVNRKNFLSNASTSSNPPSASAYITFTRKDDAAKAIEYVDGSVYDDRVLRATYGTTKYCSYFLRGLTCQNPGCMYLHEPGEEVSSYTKEQLTAGSQNLHSFIVDKAESANLKQFGTIMTSSLAPVRPVPIPAFAPSRSQNDSPRPSLTPVSAENVMSAPPGLKPAAAVEIERVPQVTDISTNSFFDKISRMITASELEELASMAPKGLAAFSPKSPPPPALNTSLGFFSLNSGQSSDAFDKTPFRTASPLDEIVAPLPRSASIMGSDSNSSCPSRQSFSFSNLPIRSPKPTTSNEEPVPARHIAIESLFPSDYRLSVPANSYQEQNSYYSEPAVKKFTTASRAMSMNTQPQSTPSSEFISVSSPSSKTGRAPAPILDQTPAPVANRNIFNILNSAKEPAEMVELSTSSSLRKPDHTRIGPVKVVSAYAMQPQSMNDLEKLAREGKLEGHITGLEEGMFRSRLEAESLEAKLKTLFEANAASKRPAPRK